jgi:hypothetical protein
MDPNQRFFAEQTEYQGYWIARNGIQTAQSKMEAILEIKAPTTRKELNHFTILLA